MAAIAAPVAAPFVGTAPFDWADAVFDTDKLPPVRVAVEPDPPVAWLNPAVAVPVTDDAKYSAAEE